MYYGKQQQQQASTTTTTATTTTVQETPRQLYIVAATLIKQQIFSLRDLYPYLTPSDDSAQVHEMQLKIETYLQTQNSEAKKTGAISLNPADDSAAANEQFKLFDEIPPMHVNVSYSES